MKWVALSSFSGSELLTITTLLDQQPIIATNNRSSKLLSVGATQLSDRPAVDEYYNLFGNDCDIVTLHGWNRIIPDAVCNRYNIYNVHPGDIVNYPTLLKGYNPQQNAVERGFDRTGVVIHKCIPELDSGEIARFTQVDIKGLDVDAVIARLRSVSIDMWVDFLNCEFDRLSGGNV
jgi:folate-dependent phosphoribosylglycinamide formyltransferase PurN